MKPKTKVSITGELKTECKKCGAWKPAQYDLCWDCYAKQPQRVTQYEKNEGYASAKDYEESLL